MERRPYGWSVDWSVTSTQTRSIVGVHRPGVSVIGSPIFKQPVNRLSSQGWGKKKVGRERRERAQLAWLPGGGLELYMKGGGGEGSDGASYCKSKKIHIIIIYFI